MDFRYVICTACFVKAEIWNHKSHPVIFIDHLASTMNQSSNIKEPKFSVHQGVQYCFVKFEFIDYVHINEQDRWWLPTRSNSEIRHNVYKCHNTVFCCKQILHSTSMMSS